MQGEHREYPQLADDLHEGRLRHGEERREPGVQSAVPLPLSGERKGISEDGIVARDSPNEGAVRSCFEGYHNDK